MWRGSETVANQGSVKLNRLWWVELAKLVYLVLVLIFNLGMCLLLLGISFFMFKFLWWAFS